MEEIGGDTRLLQHEGDLLGAFPVADIYDGRTRNFSQYINECI